MRRNRDLLVATFAQMLALLAMFLGAPAPGMAQHTVVENNGVGGRIETDYNAAGKATEMRTIGPDGKLLQKIDYEYLPGYYVAQQTDTGYWPNEKPHKVSRNSYDESSNFTGEFVQIFDESGKQVGGHRLTHDPWTGVYRCAEWNLTAQDYRAVKCPSGEEGGGGAEEPKKFTYEEVMKNLEAARREARREREAEGKNGNVNSEAPAQGDAAGARRDVALVLPAKIRRGERISGSVVEDAARYEEMPEVAVARVAIPFESSGDAARLSGWLAEVAGEKPQRADGPITFVAPRNGDTITVSFRDAGNPTHVLSQAVALPKGSAKKLRSANSFQAAALCMKGELCVVQGAFGGNSSQTFAAFENRPATIMAETSDAVYLSVPELTAAGLRPVFIEEGGKVVAFPVAVGEFFIRNYGRELEAGQSAIVFPTLDGPGDIASSAWSGRSFPDTSLDRARRLIPGFKLAGEKRGGGERREGTEARREGDQKGESYEEGEILLIVKNNVPEQTSLRRAANGMLVFHLGDEAFERGAFRYDLLVDGKKTGKIDVKGYVIPFLEPVGGQEFGVKVERP